ncbi:MAG TPA: shikimate dehydrogenase [Limnochordales bacterium]
MSGRGRLITGTTRVLCILGHPIAHSLSPVMHNRAIEALGLDYVYVAFDVAPQELGRAVQGLRALGVAGATVTIPHKEAVLAFVDEMEESVRWTGAANTLVMRQDGALVATNTDVDGVRGALQAAGLRPAGGKAVVLGAGGAARAIVAALVQEGCRHIVVLNRSPERARRLVEELAPRASPCLLEADALSEQSLRRHLADAQLLCHATPTGMHPHGDQSPVPRELVRPPLAVLDAVYRPARTRLLAQALAQGCRVASGVDWLVCQGVEAFQRWTGHRPDPALLKGALMEVLEP